ncbi:carboxypeptidase-like regulatory domain-containing protein [Culturomica massiliensis]|uniref:carboxypeptidase-like regulatory domain-containing protein n=1 Tax=Culturomica massiliensis TaxID=1841857 RepID=UPI002666BFE4|nr:carboxypeptidase-like regulatory domain-containing protein [Culturomica massiliensis]
MVKCISIGIWLVLPFCNIVVQAQQTDVFAREIRFSSSRGTVYEMLNQITEQSGFWFVYDSDLIDNEKKVTVSKGVYPLREAILQITGNNTLEMKLIGRHILLYKEKAVPTRVAVSEQMPSFLMVRGTVRDRETGEPLAYSSIGIDGTGKGVVANQNGSFLLKLPDSLLYSSLYISHLGYEPQKIATELLAGNTTDIRLQVRPIPLEEVIVRLVNPVKILKEMLEKRGENYAETPVNLTTFYREGVEKGKELLALTEAVFKVYKTGYCSLENDRVKLLKMRRIDNERWKDTLVMKIKAGIKASFTLDLTKNLPDFLTFNESNLYNYYKVDMSVVDSHLVHVIAFEQRKDVRLALYKGELYVDAENSALLRVRMEINPDYIRKATNALIVKKSKRIDITPKKVVYTVSYKPWGGKYYIGHVRGDLDFRIKKRGKLFASSVHTWFEMATCNIDTLQVRRFARRETLPINKVFSETRFMYDENFWGDLNIILPEEKLDQAISKINSRIIETE